MTRTLDLYDSVYGDYDSAAEAAVRRATYGEDIGQSSWMTASEWLEYADRAGAGPASDVLEVGSGSGGPAVYLATRRGCRVTGVDVNPLGAANARRLAVAHGLQRQVTFEIADATHPLPYPDGRFDAILSNDAMCHLPSRLDVLHDWYRLLRPSGRVLFTDAMVISGPVTHEEIATRSSIGFYVFVPPGENERLLAAAGFVLLSAEDVTESSAATAARWHDAREAHRAALVAREGAATFDGLQRFLACVRRLLAEHRLSRFAYAAEKPASSPAR